LIAGIDLGLGGDARGGPAVRCCIGGGRASRTWLKPVPDEVIEEIVDDIFLPLVRLGAAKTP